MKASTWIMAGAAVFLLNAVAGATSVTVTITGADNTQCAMILAPTPYTGGPYTGHENWGGRTFANAYEAEGGMSTSAHVLIGFALPDLGSVAIDSATLRLHRDGWLSSEGNIEAYRLLESWNEGSGSGSPTVYASELGGAGGTGFGPQTGSADWFDRAHGAATWSTPGAIGPGSSLTSPSAAFVVNNEDYFSLDVTSDLQYWYDHALANNFGWVLTSHDTDGQWRVGLRLQSDDAGYAQPMLTVNYSVIPEPVTLLTLGATLCALGPYLRRRLNG